MSARKGKNLKRVKYQLKSLEEAFEWDATARGIRTYQLEMR